MILVYRFVKVTAGIAAALAIRVEDRVSAGQLIAKVGYNRCLAKVLDTWEK